MANHHGGFAEFAAAVIRQLPDLPPDARQRWVERQGLLAEALHMALAAPRYVYPMNVFGPNDRNAPPGTRWIVVRYHPEDRNLLQCALMEAVPQYYRGDGVSTGALDITPEGNGLGGTAWPGTVIHCAIQNWIHADDLRSSKFVFLGNLEPWWIAEVVERTVQSLGGKVQATEEQQEVDDDPMYQDVIELLQAYADRLKQELLTSHST